MLLSVAPSIQNGNLLRVFDCACAGPVTKKQIQSTTGLSWGCVSSLCAELLKLELFVEATKNPTAAGRTPSRLAINSKKHLLLGLSAAPGHVTGVITDLACRVLVCEQHTAPGGALTDTLLQTVRSLMRQMPPTSVSGIAAALPGYSREAIGKSVWSHLFGSFFFRDLRRQLETDYGVPVLFANDPDCIAAAEGLNGAAGGLADFIYIHLSLGIGMGIVSDGQIRCGKNGAAGELGHMTMNPRGERCHCGNYGCLETFSSVESILRRCTEAAYTGKAPRLRHHLDAGGQLTLQAAAKAARSGDASIKNIFLKAAHYAGIAVSNVINLLDPDAVVLGGELAEYPDLFLGRLLDTAKARVWSGKADLRTALLGRDAPAVGAASLLVPHIFASLTGS